MPSETSRILKKRVLAEKLCQLRRLQRPRHFLKNHQRTEWQLHRPTNQPDRSDSGKHWQSRNPSRSDFALAISNTNLFPHIARIKSYQQLSPESFQSDDSPLPDPISLSEVHASLRKCGNSSPGLDGNHYDMLRRLPLVNIKGVLALFNQSLLSGEVPYSWQRSTIIPIPKKGKPLSEPSSYRPISLTSILWKLLKRVIATRFRWFLESRNMINQYQSGFRKGRGCLDHIVRLTQDIAAS